MMWVVNTLVSSIIGAAMALITTFLSDRLSVFFKKTQDKQNAIKNGPQISLTSVSSKTWLEKCKSDYCYKVDLSISLNDEKGEIAVYKFEEVEENVNILSFDIMQIIEIRLINSSVDGVTIINLPVSNKPDPNINNWEGRMIDPGKSISLFMKPADRPSKMIVRHTNYDLTYLFEPLPKGYKRADSATKIKK